jgi:hypothetical protein
MRSNEEVRSQVCDALQRFNDLVSTQDRQVLAEFAPGDDVLLIGSDAGVSSAPFSGIMIALARTIWSKST